MLKVNKNQLLKPEIVSEYIAFDAENKDYKYNDNDNSMFAKQYEGVAYLWHLLQTKNIALLADEVGTGKTYQALGILITLLKIKPDAKCLIIAPRYQVAMNWIREYHNFISMHYKLLDDQIKSSITHSAIPDIQYCHNLKEVKEKSNLGQIFVAKTTMFSNLKCSKETNNEEKYNRDDILNAAFEEGKEYNKSIKDKYDLLIVDEAHYYRNIKGGSLKVNAAKGFFGTHCKDKTQAEPIASKVLLMTATPNHSSKDNIKNIFSYFNYLNLKVDDSSISGCNDHAKILEEYALRRFRRLEDKNKYQYREEKSLDATFKDDIKAEMFFAVYQKKLVQEIFKSQKENGKLSENRLYYGYLEGCELISYERNKNYSYDQTEGDKDTQDYNRGIDYNVLNKVINKYNDAFNETPAHPKYDKIINTIVEKESSKQIFNMENQQAFEPEKHVVFVRRIPSVNELTERLLREYDKVLFDSLIKCLGFESKIQAIPKNREELDSLIEKNMNAYESKVNEIDIKQDNVDYDDSDANKDTTKCIMLDYFVRKKDQKSTLGSKFRTLLNDPNSPYSMLFEMPPSINDKSYELTDYLKQATSKKEIDYPESAKNERYKNYKILKYQKPKEYVFEKSSKRELITLWTIFFEYESNIDKISNLSEYEWEGLGTYTKKALLYASDSVIELFCWYLKKNENSYENFIQIVRDNFATSHTRMLMYEAIKHFRYIWEKVFGVKKEELHNYAFQEFYQATPVYGFHGATKSDTIIKLFNTPFYPNNIIATSVLQEGVNLHYYCNNVSHYGIAWTQGANEQRNGRVDRFKGRVHRSLKSNNNNSAMFISYPLLKDSVDELQVSQFIINKQFAENLIDNCRDTNEKNEITANYNSNWQEFLRKPSNDHKGKEDPYPADLSIINENQLIDKSFFSNSLKLYGKDIISDVINYFNYVKKNEKMGEISIENISTFWSEDNPSYILLYCNTKIEEKSKPERYQPVLVCCGYLPLPAKIGDERSNNYFYLKMISPVAKKDKVNDLVEKIKQNDEKITALLSKNRLSKVEINEQKEGFEHITCSTNLLVTFNNGKVFLDENEIKYSLKQVVNTADKLETILYGETDKAEFENIENNDEDKHDQEPVISELKYIANNHNDEITSQWNIETTDNMEYAYKSYEKQIENNDYKKIICTLAKYPFINYQFDNNTLKLNLYYLKNNFQKEEQKILEIWFEKAKQNIWAELNIQEEN